ncbi:MAG: UDP-N-acetylmuramoyl-tripeptide--D-alanyl-D-alanine ligase [Planctomycetes bacterium]|nr:UDP-N-acetylmuramoyl-tripeptide--D-alanyl-D-alanine ligase [Planctomycetota bacterium]
MIKTCLSSAARLLHGVLSGPDASFTGVYTDTRQPLSGGLFFALRGENFDGHDFTPLAAAQGATGVVVSRGEALPAGVPALVVPDTFRALADLASGHRDSLSCRVICVTGSFGKTTVKRSLALFLGDGAWASPASYNNLIGVPLSVLNAPDGIDWLVAEAGVNHPGEMAPLAAILRPDVAVFTGVGPVHLEGFGDISRIADEKALLCRHVRDGGQVFLSGDADPVLGRAVERYSRRKLSIRRTGPPGLALAGMDRDGMTVVSTPAGETHVSVCPVGQLDSLTLAWGIAGSLAGDDAGLLVDRLRRFTPLDGRWNVVRVDEGRIILVDDAYNANPVSMAAALDGLALLPVDRTVAVLGAMRELGPTAAGEHLAVGGRAAKSGVSVLFAVGEMADKYLEGYGASGAGEVFSAAPAAADALLPFLQALEGRAAVLVKGSHSVGLETVVEAVRAAFPG